MARRKKPETETAEQVELRRLYETISNSANRGEKTSWNRKMDKMVKLLAQLRPLEQQILDLEAQKLPILDQVQEVRSVMLNECIHPYEYLTLIKDDCVLCKFCNRKIVINETKKT